jgi:hypothetical protein
VSASDKHSNLLQHGKITAVKSFIIQTPVPNLIELFV